MLKQLWYKDNQSQNSLRRTIGLDHSTVAKSVKRLEEAGFVIRSQSAEDKRVVIVSLTQAGRDLEGRVMEACKRLETNTTKGISEEEQVHFLAIVQKMVTNLES